MAIPNLISNPFSNGWIASNDKFVMNPKTMVYISCKSRNITVKAPMSEPLNLASKATWKPVGGGLGSLSNNPLGKLGTFVSGAATSGLGVSFHQPWFSRCMYESTDPLQFNITMDFASSFNSFDEVYKPCLTLLSLLYPRIIDKASLEKSGFTLGLFRIPGPHALYPLNQGGSADLSDPMRLDIANMVTLEVCYLTSVSLSIDPYFDPDGYPLHIKAVVSVSTFDNCYVSEDGSFMSIKSYGSKMTMKTKQIESAVASATVTSPMDSVANNLSQQNKAFNAFTGGNSLQPGQMGSFYPGGF